MRTESPYLFVIRAGPIWSVEELLASARTFGVEFNGEIITWGGSDQEVHAGKFRARTLRWRLDWPRLSRIAFVSRVISRGLWIRWVLADSLLVISYDPFQSGIMALVLKWFAGAKFICEVNGVYWHPDTFIDVPNPAVAEAKRRRMVKVGSFVLSHADMLKPLYSGQLEGFNLSDPGARSMAFPDIVDSELFVPTGVEPQKRIIFVGHPFLLKGVDLLLRAFEEVASAYPEWRLVLVGFKIEKAARPMARPEGRVDFLGPQKASVIRDLIEGSSFLVLPSRSEGMGRVLLEAALLGRARIGSRAGGIPSVIEDGVDGLLFETGSSDDLARALRRLMESPDYSRKLGEQARERALREFTTEAYLNRYRSLIESVISTKSR